MTALATDNFNRTDAGNLGANWTKPTGAFAEILLTSNQAAPQTNTCLKYYSAISWVADQYAKCTLKTMRTNSDEGCGPAVRVANNQCYFVQSNTVETRLYRINGGAYLQRGSDMPAGATNDIWEVRVSGTGTSTVVVVKQNGTQRLSFTDNDGNSLASGNAGAWGYGGTFDDWEGGDLNAPAFKSAFARGSNQIIA